MGSRRPGICRRQPAGKRELRRCRGQSTVHHGQGPGRPPALPVPLLGLPRQVPADRSVHRTILRTRAARADHAGFVGLLVSNSFMKRDFGRPLIEDFLSEIDLTHVLDTSGAYIPGHGTPTVILLGRARRPVGRTVRTALGLRGEPTQPADPADGLVWKALTSQIDEPGTTSEWIQVADIDRQRFARHPWSLSGGTANDVLLALDTGDQLSQADSAHRLLRHHRIGRRLHRTYGGIPANRRRSRGHGHHHQRFRGARLGGGSTGERVLPWHRYVECSRYRSLPAPSSTAMAIPHHAWHAPVLRDTAGSRPTDGLGTAGTR